MKGKPPVSDLFGLRGRRWLAAQDLPADEQETITACLRQIEFLDGEIALIERALAEHVLASAELRRLLTLRSRPCEKEGATSVRERVLSSPPDYQTIPRSHR